MKRQLISLICAATMAMALPTLAWAAPSNSNTTTASQDGVTISVSSPFDTAEGGLTVSTADMHASNYVAPASGNDVLVETFEISTWGNVSASSVNDVNVALSIGSQYAGMTARVYIQHDSGATETRTVTVAADGTVAFSMNQLSWVTIAVADGQPNNASLGSNASSQKDTSARSPQTGDATDWTPLVSVVMLGAAGGVAVALRKRTSE